MIETKEIELIRTCETVKHYHNMLGIRKLKEAAHRLNLNQKCQKENPKNNRKVDQQPEAVPHMRPMQKQKTKANPNAGTEETKDRSNPQPTNETNLLFAHTPFASV